MVATVTIPPTLAQAGARANADLTKMLGASVLALQHGMTFAFRDFLDGNGGSPGVLPTNPALGRLAKFDLYQYAGSIIYMPTIGYVRRISVDGASTRSRQAER